METINIATNVKCPKCYRKICKIRDYDGQELIEFKHKGSELITKEALIRCVDCQSVFQIDTSGIVEEV